MKTYVILLLGFVLGVAACAEKEQGISAQVAETPLTIAESTPPAEDDQSWRSNAFLGHMHLHAEKLDDLNFALSDGDLNGARMPASWLSRHDTVDNIQAEWIPFLYRMRTEAETVESATDLATARDAAERLNAQCQGCHEAAGISIG